MADSREFELLGLDEDGYRTFEEHEVRTAPLVSRDAVDLGEPFPQRALLGSVLSIHADSLPSRPNDRRVYMNLDAPSSGLVCGVQGSGKSHTVSCILESALITDERIGTLPVPLATLVFHYDEENGKRPCEAAYLSEMKNQAGPGVDQVTVLVSPSNFNARCEIYRELRRVQVLPLKLSEEDLNAARMLAMMNASNLERMPLYMSTVLSILRELSTNGFSYQEFQKRLNESKFDPVQKMMLQQRMNLLNSFLKGNGSHLSSFFKPGSLVIVDLSDPFVEATTAAMLFDICLGVFIEWRGNTVLDEAHKYLTNTDTNLFTRSICSIIRQQRHLAARVIVSTQEPTVVPATVLDLLAWIICHRFSSPSWVSHLSNHVCIQKKEDFTDEWDAVEADWDWGRHVMTLSTGQAILYSPGSLFASNQGRSELLGTGCAIIKTRARLTTDGGESLLATQTPQRRPFGAGIITPSSSPSAVSSASPPITQVGPVNVDIDNIWAAPNVKEQPRTTSSSVNSTIMEQVETTSARNPPSSNQKVFGTWTNTSVPVPATCPVAPQSPPTQYKILVDVLKEKQSETGFIEANMSSLSVLILQRRKDAYTGNFRLWLEQAAQEGIITMRQAKGTYWVALCPPFTTSSALPAAHTTNGLPAVERSSNRFGKFNSLISAIAEVAPDPRTFAPYSIVGETLKKQNTGGYKEAGYTRLKDFINAAKEAGLVNTRNRSGRDEVAARRLSKD